MKKLSLVIILCVSFFLFPLATKALENEKSFLICSTLHYPDEAMQAIFEEHVFPNPDMVPPLSKTFRLNSNYLMMAENATIINVVASHPWWQVEDKKVSTEKGISVISFTVNGSWNPSNQPVQDWPGGNECSIFKIEYHINNPSFGLGVWVDNKVQAFYGLSLEKQKSGSWMFELQPGYIFPIPWAVQKNDKQAIAWSALKVGK